MILHTRVDGRVHEDAAVLYQIVHERFIVDGMDNRFADAHVIKGCKLKLERPKRTIRWDGGIPSHPGCPPDCGEHSGRR